ncbi:MAG: hypothetical protein J6Q11_05295 [Fibrobacteraceae bacterium]|nr:hypothetical protein [Fibrobacteraceae bacterium]
MKKLLPYFAALFLFAFANAEESPSLWQRFTNFFNPAPSVSEEGKTQDEIRELDKKISTLRVESRREHRPQRKSMLRKEIEELSAKRDSLLATLKTPNEQTKETITPKKDTTIQQEIPVCSKDTIKIIEREIIREIIRDTVFIHDTIYVCDSIAKTQTDSIQTQK